MFMLYLRTREQFNHAFMFMRFLNEKTDGLVFSRKRPRPIGFCCVSRLRTHDDVGLFTAQRRFVYRPTIGGQTKNNQFFRNVDEFLVPFEPRFTLQPVRSSSTRTFRAVRVCMPSFLKLRSVLVVYHNVFGRVISRHRNAFG